MKTAPGIAKTGIYGVNISENESLVTLSVGETSYAVSKENGLLVSAKDNGKEMLCAPMQPTIWRAPTDNDREIKIKWLNEGFDTAKSVCNGVTIKTDKKGNVSIVSSISLGKYIKIKATYTADNFGKLTVRTDVKNRSPIFLPKFGYELTLHANTENYTYFGYGPHESYVDKRLSARVGRFTGKIDDDMEHYVLPQENGSHYGTEWATVKSNAGHGLRFESKEPFVFRASHYSTAQLDSAKHDYELVPSENTFVYIDYKQSGIGSNSCGPVLAESMRFEENSFEFEFSIAPVRQI